MSLTASHTLDCNGKHANSIAFSQNSPNLLAVVANENYAVAGEYMWQLCIRIL